MRKRQIGLFLMLLLMIQITVPLAYADHMWNTNTHNRDTGVSGGSEKVLDILDEYGISIPNYIWVDYIGDGKNYSAGDWWIFVYWNMTVVHNIPEPESDDSTSGGNIMLEDGISWDNIAYTPHELLVVWLKPKIYTCVNITISSDYGTYNKIFYTRARTYCIYFKAERFTGNYTITVTASNALGAYIPVTLFTG